MAAGPPLKSSVYRVVKAVGIHEAFGGWRTIEIAAEIGATAGEVGRVSAELSTAAECGESGRGERRAEGGSEGTGSRGSASERWASEQPAAAQVPWPLAPGPRREVPFRLTAREAGEAPAP